MIFLNFCSKVCLTCRALRTVMSWNISLAEWGDGVALKASWRAAACEISFKQYKKREIFGWLQQTNIFVHSFGEKTYTGEAMKFLTLIRRGYAIQDDSLRAVQGRGCHANPDVTKREFLVSFWSRCWFDIWNSITELRCACESGGIGHVTCLSLHLTVFY